MKIEEDEAKINEVDISITTIETITIKKKPMMIENISQKKAAINHLVTSMTIIKMMTEVKMSQTKGKMRMMKLLRISIRFFRTNQGFRPNLVHLMLLAERNRMIMTISIEIIE